MSSCVVPSDPLLCQVPTALVTFADSGGRPWFRPALWVGIVCASPPIVSLALGPCPGAADFMACPESFAVNLLPEELVGDGEFLAGLWALGGDPSGLRGLALGSDQAALPLLGGCPVVLECGAPALGSRHGRRTLRGEIRGFYQDAVHYGPQAEVALWSLLRTPRLAVRQAASD